MSNSNTKHTPGPWVVFQSVTLKDGIPSIGVRLKRKRKDWLYEDWEGNQYNCLCVIETNYQNGKYGSQEDDANARLIAAAPEMLAALHAALYALEMNHHLVTNAEERMISVKGQSAVVKAIAKAEGRSE